MWFLAAIAYVPPLLAASSAACERSVYHILRGQYDAALRQLEGATSTGSAPADVENLRGLALMLDGKAQEATAAFDKALSLDPKHGPARLNRGIAALRGGDPAAAVIHLELVWSDPGSPLRAQAAYHRAIALDRLGKPADAEGWLARAVELDPALDSAVLYAGFLKERRGDVAGAARSYLDYLKKHPASAEAMLRLGLSAQKAGRIDVARLYLNRVIAAAPGSPQATEARKFLILWE